MNKIYITDNSRPILVDSDDNIRSITSDREAINRVILLDDDYEIVSGEYKEDGSFITKRLIGKKGQIMIAFYENSFKHKIILVDNEDWVENIIEYKKKLEEIRSKSDSVSGECDCTCEAKSCNC